MPISRTVSSGLEFEQVRHRCNHEQLRDHLPEPDRNRHVGIGIRLDFNRHKLVPRDLPHGPEYSVIEAGLADQGTDIETRVSPDSREHLLSLILEMFRAHDPVS